MITQSLPKVSASQEESAEASDSKPMHFFLHIPKCGGTTFSDYLSRHFPRSAIYTADKSIADYQIHQQLKAAGQISSKDNFRLLSQRYVESMQSCDLIVENHFEWIVMQSLVKSRKLVLYTLLRDPRERIVSHYKHLRRIPLDDSKGLSHDQMAAYRLARELSFGEFCRQIDQFYIWSNFYNLQTRFLSSHHLNRVIWSQLGEQAILEDALKNLSRIEYVADVKDLNEFARLISLDSHWLPPGRLGALNAGEHSSQTEADLISQVPDSLVALDQVLYEEGLKKYAAWREKVLQKATLELWRNSHQRDQRFLSEDEWELNFEDELFGDNFHGREGKGKETFRWMGPDRESHLYLPVRPGVPHWISVYLLAFITPEMFSKTTYFINGREVAPVCSTAEGCTVVTFAVDPADTNSGVVELAIRADHTTTEYALNRSSDKREKSIAVKRVKLSLHPPT
ncbi:MAG: sulfotransferase family 2 domain-containing protein [Planctomycetaceae bacterium]|nr:sulfotransferase family 2 domain-containing protein [Planctomycetaceae bacterium]